MLSRTRVLVPAVLAAGLVLTGCSEEVSGAASPAPDAPSSSSPASSPSSSGPGSSTDGGEHEAFCTEAEEVFGEVETAFDAVGDTDVVGLADALQQAVDAFDALEPPAEIAEDWQVSRDGFAQLRDAVAAIDPADPDAAAQALEVISELETTLGPSFERVGSWIDENCPNA